jgi:hypothetical protein
MPTLSRRSYHDPPARLRLPAVCPHCRTGATGLNNAGARDRHASATGAFAPKIWAGWRLASRWPMRPLLITILRQRSARSSVGAALWTEARWHANAQTDPTQCAAMAWCGRRARAPGRVWRSDASRSHARRAVRFQACPAAIDLGQNLGGTSGDDCGHNRVERTL